MSTRRRWTGVVRPFSGRAVRMGSVIACLLGAGFLGACRRSSEPPKRKITINVIDAAGSLAVLQQGIEAYRTRNPDVVSRFTFTKAPAPELPGKLRAMQNAGRMDIDLVLGGTDILAAGIDQG